MDRVRELLARGFPAREVAAETGVPQTTVSRWGRGRTAAFGSRVDVAPWRPPHDGSYAYLLGVYLGDGHVYVSSAGRAWLRVFLDAAYPEIVEECVTAVGLTALGHR